jgi:hypothetical protein
LRLYSVCSPCLSVITAIYSYGASTTNSNSCLFPFYPACLLPICGWVSVIYLVFAARGFDRLGTNIRTTSVWSGLTHTFPGMGKEFMPSLDEGSFLLMPTSMPHSGIEENRKILQQLDMLVTAIPEVDMVVGKPAGPRLPSILPLCRCSRI